jgi:uncharacterized protein (DUF2252 family)
VPLPASTGTIVERRARGKAARERISRSDLGSWDSSTRTLDPVATTLAQSEDRIADLSALRYARMAASPWHFYRGAAAIMAGDLASRPNTGLHVQMCGDAHVLNFGLWATPERNLAFDLRDFDETLPGPFEWDVQRLATSLVIAARENGQAGMARDAARAAVRGYRKHLAECAAGSELDVWYDITHVDTLLDAFTQPEARELMHARITRQASRNTSRVALEKLTEPYKGHLRITERAPFRVHLADAERTQAVSAYDNYLHSLRDPQHLLLERFRLVDVARQVVGVGSVGMRIYLVLLEGRGGDDPVFLQIKQASASVYEPLVAPSEYENHGQRVIVGKRLMQSASDIFVGWTSVEDRDYYVRQFRDMKVVPNSQRIAPHLVDFAAACGAVLARAHARSGDALAISSYIGKNRSFERAVTDFAVTYAKQNARDFETWVGAVHEGRVAIAEGPAW